MRLMGESFKENSKYRLPNRYCLKSTFEALPKKLFMQGRKVHQHKLCRGRALHQVHISSHLADSSAFEWPS